MMKKLVTFFSIITLCLGVLNPIYVNADGFNYSVDFDENGDWMGGSFIQLSTPERDAYNNNVFTTVTSKNNDPRSAGTRPHEGTDLGMSVYEDVYPLYGGEITYKGSWSLSMKIFDKPTYATYLHLTPYTKVNFTRG